MYIKKMISSTQVFYLAYIFLLISVYASRIVFFNDFLKVFKLISLLLFFVTFLINSKMYSKKSLLIIVLLLILSLIVSYYSGNITMPILLLIVISFKDKDKEKFIANDIKIKIILIIAVLFFYFIGLTDNLAFYRNGIIRNSYGFPHPNLLMITLVMLFVEFLYLHRSHFKYKYLFLCIPIVLINTLNIDSRTCIYFMLIIVILYIVNKNKIINKLFLSPPSRLFIRNLFLISFIITSVSYYLYITNSQIGFYLNDLLSGRLYSIKLLLSNYKINLFGNDLLLISTEEAYNKGIKAIILDNCYFHLLLHYGIVTFFTFYIAFKKLINTFFQNKETLLIIIFASFMILGLSETYLFKIEINIFLIYLSDLIYDKKVKKEKERKIINVR